MGWLEQIEDGIGKLREWTLDLSSDELDALCLRVGHEIAGLDKSQGVGGCLRLAMAKLESPIEQAMLASLTLVAATQRYANDLYLACRSPEYAWISYYRIPECEACDASFVHPHENKDRADPESFHYYDRIIVTPQFRVARHRIDFLVEYQGWMRKPGTAERELVKESLLVECDGHDFHERTKEQAARDRARDRELQSAGYMVFRFTGAEIWRDPVGCAVQTLEDIAERMNRARWVSWGHSIESRPKHEPRAWPPLRDVAAAGKRKG